MYNYQRGWLSQSIADAPCVGASARQQSQSTSASASSASKSKAVTKTKDTEKEVWHASLEYLDIGKAPPIDQNYFFTSRLVAEQFADELISDKISPDWKNGLKGFGREINPSDVHFFAIRKIILFVHVKCF